MVWLRKYWVFVLILTVLVYSFTSSILNKDSSDEEKSPIAVSLEETETAQEVESIQEEKTALYIDVKGEVDKPGVYIAKEGERVKDLIERAGGFKEQANAHQVNLALKVFDEMVIYVPSLTDATMGDGLMTNMIPPSASKVRINSATKEEIMTLDGIGETKAMAIITYRDEHGLFQSVDDLLLVTGIGEKTLEKISNDIQIP